jgi:hypothetical protein
VAARSAASPPDGHPGGGAKRGDMERCADSMRPGAGQLKRDQTGGLRRSLRSLLLRFLHRVASCLAVVHARLDVA